MAALQIGLGPADGLGRIERDGRRFDRGRQSLGIHARHVRGLVDARRQEVAAQLLMECILVKVCRREIEQLEALRVVEIVPEPGKRIAVFHAVLRQREVEIAVRLKHNLRATDQDGIEDRARVAAGLEKLGELLEITGFGLAQTDLDQRV